MRQAEQAVSGSCRYFRMVVEGQIPQNEPFQIQESCLSFSLDASMFTVPFQVRLEQEYLTASNLFTQPLPATLRFLCCSSPSLLLSSLVLPQLLIVLIVFPNNTYFKVPFLTSSHAMLKCNWH